MKKLTLLVDMDDTIENMLVEWIHILNERYGRYVVLEDAKDWDLTKAYPGLTKTQVYAPLYTDELWKNVKPKWDAIYYLKRLQEDGHDIYITTSSNFNTINVKVSSIIERYFSFISWEHVIVASRKQMIRGDVMIDDGVHNLVGGDYVKILVDAPYNRSFNEKECGMHRAKNWAEIYELINTLSKE